MTCEGLTRRGARLEYATVGWNAVGAALLIIAALAAGSPALAGFGLDSAVEIFASGVVVWQLKGVAEERERRALRLIGVAFLGVAAYVLGQSLRVLAAGGEPNGSVGGRPGLV